ncbi:hypothetical protein EPR50_G00044980 [Perca flavescens]|uniref:Uncharacterized protein n=1 Tax=Perca flavescens TaxID=8167 RepID=A0A484DG82_PERFV|nr:hypothetical protein EPR50_G00044980 [Perca flavescens]
MPTGEGPGQRLLGEEPKADYKTLGSSSFSPPPELSPPRLSLRSAWRVIWPLRRLAVLCFKEGRKEGERVICRGQVSPSSCGAVCPSQ